MYGRPPCACWIAFGKSVDPGRTKCQAAIELAVGEAVDAVLIGVLEQEIVVEQAGAGAHYGTPAMAGIPGQADLRSEIVVRIVDLVAERLVNILGERRKETVLVEDQVAARARRAGHENVEIGTRHGAEIAIVAVGVVNVIDAEVEIQIWKNVEGVAEVAFEPRVGMPAEMAEGRVSAEVAETIKDRDRTDRIVERIFRRLRSAADCRRWRRSSQVRWSSLLKDRSCRPGIPVVSLNDAVDGTAEVEDVIDDVGGVAVVARVKIALLGLARTRDGRASENEPNCM